MIGEVGIVLGKHLGYAGALLVIPLEFVCRQLAVHVFNEVNLLLVVSAPEIEVGAKLERTAVLAPNS